MNKNLNKLLIICTLKMGGPQEDDVVVVPGALGGCAAETAVIVHPSVSDALIPAKREDLQKEQHIEQLKTIVQMFINRIGQGNSTFAPEEITTLKAIAENNRKHYGAKIGTDAYTHELDMLTAKLINCRDVNSLQENTNINSQDLLNRKEEDSKIYETISQLINSTYDLYVNDSKVDPNITPSYELKTMIEELRKYVRPACAQIPPEPAEMLLNLYGERANVENKAARKQQAKDEFPESIEKMKAALKGLDTWLSIIQGPDVEGEIETISKALNDRITDLEKLITSKVTVLGTKPKLGRFSTWFQYEVKDMFENDLLIKRELYKFFSEMKEIWQYLLMKVGVDTTQITLRQLLKNTHEGDQAKDIESHIPVQVQALTDAMGYIMGKRSDADQILAAKEMGKSIYSAILKIITTIQINHGWKLDFMGLSQFSDIGTELFGADPAGYIDDQQTVDYVSGLTLAMLHAIKANVLKNLLEGKNEEAIKNESLELLKKLRLLHLDNLIHITDSSTYDYAFVENFKRTQQENYQFTFLDKFISDAMFDLLTKGPKPEAGAADSISQAAPAAAGSSGVRAALSGIAGAAKRAMGK